MSRKLNATLYTFEKYVFNELEKENIAYDVFWSTMAATEVVKSRESSDTFGPVDPYDLKLLDPCQFTVSSQEYIRLNEFNIFVKSFGIKLTSDGRPVDPAQDFFHDGFSSVKNALCAYHTQHILDGMIKAHETVHNFKYDVVIALRPDTAMMRPIDLAANLKRVRAENNTIWLPNFQHWEGLNDRAAYGSREVMSIYLNRGLAFRDGKYESPRVVSEPLVRRMVDDHGIKVELSTMRVLRVRQNGFVAEKYKHQGMEVSESEYYQCVDRHTGHLTLTC